MAGENELGNIARVGMDSQGLAKYQSLHDAVNQNKMGLARLRIASIRASHATLECFIHACELIPNQ